MNLYVVRHAEAVQLSGTITRDFDRPLTEQGKQEALLMGRILARLDKRVKSIFSSPLVRAVETANIISTELRGGVEVFVSDTVSPGFNQKALLTDILERTDGGSAMIVGHQPDMSMFVAYLMCESQGMGVAMVPCSIACLGIQQNSSAVGARLIWLLTPELISDLQI